MDQNICYNCGGELIARGGRRVCLYCGSYAPANISDEEAILLASASQKLRLADFYEAEQEFEDIIRRYPHNAQGYWGHMLARYGIKYEEDYDGSRIPTCYAAELESVYESIDYKKALTLADPESKAVFEDHAGYIERVRLEWLERASKEPSYDIFISYKDSDREGGIKRTQDSFAMQDLYFQLKARGYRVFFSHESLRGKTGEKYEPYIYGALSTAKIMLVYGSKPEYISATWVKNEWMRYLKRLKNGEKRQGSLLVAYEGFAPSALPTALSSLQCFDAGEKRFYTDLFETVERLLGDDAAKTPVSRAVSSDTEGEPCKHEPMIIPGKAPTCTEEGRTDFSVCTLCGKTLEIPAVIPATGHIFGKWYILKRATCTEDGLHERVCRCGAKETEPISARGFHVPGEWEIVKEPSRGTEGLRVKRCTLCGELMEEYRIPALPEEQSFTAVKNEDSQGLSYEVNRDGKTCTVTGLGSCKDRNVVISERINRYRVTRIGDMAFRDCRTLASVTLPDSLESIGGRSFSGCTSLTEIAIPPSVTIIEKWAFAHCTNLACVRIPDSVKSIGPNAFWYCKRLDGVLIPKSVTNIGDSAFAEAGSVLVSEDNPNYLSIEGNLYTKDRETLLHYAANKRDSSFRVPDFVIRIDSRAFSGSESLRDVTVPDSVTSIGNGAFCGCRRLTAVNLGSSVAEIDKCVFWNCESLAEIVIPDRIPCIEEYTFRGCSSLTGAVIPGSVTCIGERAFSECKNLEYAVIPGSVTNIGKWAFADCERLAEFRYTGSKRQWKKILLGTDWHINSAIQTVECSLGKIKL